MIGYPQLEGTRWENIAWRSELRCFICTVNNIYLSVFYLFGIMYNVSQIISKVILISTGKNSMLLPVDQTEALTS